MKNSIAFFCCSNGYGHFKRVLSIAELLKDVYDVHIYCEKYQFDKFKPDLKVNFHFYKISNIRWDETLNTNKVNFEDYYKWCSLYGPIACTYDKVISDNIIGLLRFCKKVIISGSFLWKDVFYSKFGKNKITDFDNELLDKYSPTIITNKYLETQSLVDYKNTRKFGFGCKDIKVKLFEIKKIVAFTPSLNYNNLYKEFISNIPNKIFNDISIVDNCAYAVRPGGGMFTHCVENFIPIIALYHDNDSSEIKELANKVEELGLGFKQNIEEKFNKIKFNALKNNHIYNKVSLDKGAYQEIAKFLI